MPTQSPVSRPMTLRQGRARGFTMIEMLTVIAIIALISGILVLSLTAIIGHRQEDQTVALLKRLDNAMVELTTSPAGAFKMYSIQLPNIYFPPIAGTTDYTQSNFKSWVGVPATALESQVRTAMVLEKIVSTNPSAKQFLADLPPERKKLISWTTTLTTPAKYSYTMPLDAWGNPILFVFDGLLIPTGTNVGRPFTVKLSAPEEVYVGGLTNLIVNSDKSYYEPVDPLTPLPTYPTGANTDMPNMSLPYDRSTNPKYTTYVAHPSISDPTGVKKEPTYRSPDHKPYWMSAGPDGRYDTQDDNVYSFGH